MVLGAIFMNILVFGGGGGGGIIFQLTASPFVTFGRYAMIRSFVSNFRLTL